jgi:hypothetical protein
MLFYYIFIAAFIFSVCQRISANNWPLYSVSNQLAGFRCVVCLGFLSSVAFKVVTMFRMSEEQAQGFKKGQSKR